MGWAHRVAYRALRPLLFAFDAERVHHWTIERLAEASDRGGLLRQLITLERFDDPVEVAGLQFPNRVGLAAGLDKEARCIAAFAAMGFGFIEVGSVAPRAETWSQPPRIDRLPDARALINRIGLHRGGIEALCAALERRPAPADPRSAIPIRLGVNLACNVATPAEQAIDDYAIGLQRTAARADYFAINLSNPNAPNRHVPTERAALADWMARLDEKRIAYARPGHRPAPLFLKISPDLGDEAAEQLADALKMHTAHPHPASLRWGLIVANTSARREGLEHLAQAPRPGGLSGAPLKPLADRRTRMLRAALGPSVPIIGVGGILSADDALERIAAGADLVQLYTGLIYQGPDLVARVAKALRGGA